MLSWKLSRQNGLDPLVDPGLTGVYYQRSERPLRWTTLKLQEPPLPIGHRLASGMGLTVPSLVKAVAVEPFEPFRGVEDQTVGEAPSIDHRKARGTPLPIRHSLGPGTRLTGALRCESRCGRIA